MAERVVRCWRCTVRVSDLPFVLINGKEYCVHCGDVLQLLDAIKEALGLLGKKERR